MTSRVFTFSPNNTYANDYYNACKKFDNIQAKVINYEHKTDDRESPEYKKMIEEFRYWDNQVPETSNIAGAYEVKLAQKEEEKQAKQDKQNVSNPIGMNLNYLA